MKIAIILPQLEISGGAERVIINLANYWVQHNTEVILITFKKNKSTCYPLSKEVKQCCLLEKHQTFLKFINKIITLRTILKKQQINIAIGVDTRANFILSLATTGIKKLITIATEHRYPGSVPGSKILLKIIRAFCASRMHAMVALNKQCKLWFQQYTNFKNIVVINNPIIYPLPVHNPVVKPDNIIDIKKQTLLAVGRLDPIKGFDLLITAFNQLSKKHSNWQLVILGDGNERIKLEQQIKQLNLESKVYLPGAVGNLGEWYMLASIFVLSSLYEGFGYVLIEAMAYGLPVVSFNCESGPKNIIDHNINGLLVENGNIEALIITLDKIITDKKLSLQIASNATIVRDKYNINKIANEWNNLFNSLL